jgi:xylulokinase
MALIGLDIGTTGCKASILDLEGNIRSSAYSEYRFPTSSDGSVELDPNLIWESVGHVVREAAHTYRGEKIQALSASSFGEAMVAFDGKDRILPGSISYTDARGTEEVRLLEKKLGRERIHRITGATPHPMYSIGKLMWLKDNRPEVYSDARRLFLIADFILYKMGAEPHTDYSLAARTMAFDVINKQWSSVILDAAGIDQAKLSPPVQAGTIVGELKASLAKDWKLPSDIQLVAGGHDQPCAALGAGVIDEGLAVDGMGTTECITPAFKEPLINDAMAQSNFVCAPHVVADMYVTYAFTMTAGAVLKWFRDRFASDESEEARRTGRDVYDILINRIGSDPTGLLFMPHFAGSGTPYMDPESKGALLGLSSQTTKQDIVKAILEGITYEMMVNLEGLAKAGIGVLELRAVGGLAKSERFLQLKADMMEPRIVSLNISEAGTVGTAILAGTACGAYNSVASAVKSLVRIKRSFEPEKKQRKAYRRDFERYKKIYSAAKEITR